MDYPWLKNPRVLVLGPLALFLVLAIACGAAATATPPPTASSGSPTARPEATMIAVPGDDLGGMGLSFADYWKPPTSAYGEPIRGGTLRVIYEDPLDHGNTWGAATGAADRFRSPTMNLIVQENPYDASAEIIPDLAQSWVIADDATSVTFTFHEGIKWHNGDDFNCEDARFSLHAMATGEGLTASYMRGRLEYIDATTLACNDDGTLFIGLKGPSATPLLSLTNRRAPIFNKAWFEAGGEAALFQDISVGTGAFVWEPGQSVGTDEQRYERNPNYFLPELPYLDNLVIFGIVDESAQQAAMLSHQGDWHWVRNFGQYEAYVDHDQIQTVIRPTRGHHAIWMNPRNPPLDNVRVRQAIAMGIDRGAAIQVLLSGYGSAGFQMPPGGAWELSEELGCAVPGWCIAEDMPARRAEARQILEEEGFDFNKVLVMTVESDAQVQARAVFIQEQLRLLGIQTDFDTVETTAYRAQENEGRWGDFLTRNDTMPADDPTAGLGGYLRCTSSENRWTPPNNCDAELEALLDQVDTTLDQAERKRINDEIQLHTMNLYMKFPLYWEQEAVAFWPEVRGYAHFPAPYGSWLKYQHMWIDESHMNDRGFSGQRTGLPGGI